MADEYLEHLRAVPLFANCANSDLAAIAAGSLALMLPAATVDGAIDALDALFTATSAVCRREWTWGRRSPWATW